MRPSGENMARGDETCSEHLACSGQHALQPRGHPMLIGRRCERTLGSDDTGRVLTRYTLPTGQAMLVNIFRPDKSHNLIEFYDAPEDYIFGVQGHRAAWRCMFWLAFLIGAVRVVLHVAWCMLYGVCCSLCACCAHSPMHMEPLRETPFDCNTGKGGAQHREGRGVLARHHRRSDRRRSARLGSILDYWIMSALACCNDSCTV